MGTSRASRNLIYKAMGKSNLVAGAKKLTHTTKTAAYDFPKEIIKRVVSPSYYRKKVIDPMFK